MTIQAEIVDPRLRAALAAVLGRMPGPARRVVCARPLVVLDDRTLGAFRLGQTEWIGPGRGARRPVTVVSLNRRALAARGWDEVVGLISHELAHVHAIHQGLDRGEISLTGVERSADNLAAAWGFYREIDRLHGRAGRGQ